MPDRNVDIASAFLGAAEDPLAGPQYAAERIVAGRRRGAAIRAQQQQQLSKLPDEQLMSLDPGWAEQNLDPMTRMRYQHLQQEQNQYMQDLQTLQQMRERPEDFSEADIDWAHESFASQYADQPGAGQAAAAAGFIKQERQRRVTERQQEHEIKTKQQQRGWALLDLEEKRREEEAERGREEKEVERKEKRATALLRIQHLRKDLEVERDQENKKEIRRMIDEGASARQFRGFWMGAAKATYAYILGMRRDAAKRTGQALSEEDLLIAAQETKVKTLKELLAALKSAKKPPHQAQILEGMPYDSPADVRRAYGEALSRLEELQAEL